MNVLLWHVHGSWTTAFVQGAHRYLLPVVEGRGPDGLGRARTWDWPGSAIELAPEELAGAAVDVVVVQRPRDLELAARWLGDRRLGADVPVVWLEHNAPQGRIAEMRHPVADHPAIDRIVHVTHTNDLFWDCGSTPTTVIEHGIIDPGQMWSGEVQALAAAINEPVRRGRVTGTDLLDRFAAAGPVDLFGMGVAALADTGRPWLSVHEDLRQHRLHQEMSRRRAYLHPFRWTSLGLTLLEAMHLGMPVVALATTEAHDAVPSGCGVVSNDVASLVEAARHLLHHPDEGARLGAAGRAHAVERYGLKRFLSDWDRLLEEHGR